VYAAAFTRLGAAEVLEARPSTREEAHDPAYAELLSRVSGVFMTGGNQLKLSAVVNGTPFGAFGPGGATPKQRMTQVAAGLGLLPDCVVDQHFTQRNRYGRLLSIVAHSPNLLGVGVDENTAMVVTRHEERLLLEVMGKGAVTVVDGGSMVTNASSAKGARPLLASGVTLHVLPAGAVFDMTARVLVDGGDEVDDAEAEELAVAGRDLSRLARDIAAGDIAPSVLRRRLARRRSRRLSRGEPA
jgi:cyanophycinase